MKNNTDFYKIIIGAGGISLGVSSFLAVKRISRLFLPSTTEILNALFLSVVLLILGIFLIVFGAKAWKKKSKEIALDTLKQADTYSRSYNYKSANEALVARAIAWENQEWSDESKRNEAIASLYRLADNINNLSQMSDTISMALSKELKYTVLGAVGRIDNAILDILSRFILYCIKASAYELSVGHFKTTYDSVAKEVDVALDKYAKLHTKLTRFKLCEQDSAEYSAEYEKLKSEIDLI